MNSMYIVSRPFEINSCSQRKKCARELKQIKRQISMTKQQILGVTSVCEFNLLNSTERNAAREKRRIGSKINYAQGSCQSLKAATSFLVKPNLIIQLPNPTKQHLKFGYLFHIRHIVPTKENKIIYPRGWLSCSWDYSSQSPTLGASVVQVRGALR